MKTLIKTSLINVLGQSGVIFYTLLYRLVLFYVCMLNLLFASTSTEEALVFEQTLEVTYTS